MGHVVISGANRGIGFGLVQRYLEDGFQIWAGVRNMGDSGELMKLSGNSGLRIHPLDISNQNSVNTFVAWIKSTTGFVDILINNAGIMDSRPRHLKEINLDVVQNVFNVNVLGTLRLTKALLMPLKASKQGKVANISSLMGSISDNSSGGYYAYRSSKTALNMITKCMALDLNQDKIASIAIHPGWVQTDMGGPNANVTIHESTTSIKSIIDNVDIETSGMFIQYDGEKLPW